MAHPRAHILNAGDVAAAGSRWNDLWQRSEVTSPTVRAESLQNWLQSFAPGAEFRAVVVEQQDQFAAALPLIKRRWARLVSAGSLPANAWSSTGDLLLDPRADVPTVLASLASALDRLGWPLFRLSLVRSEAAAWRQLRHTLLEAGWGVECRPSFDVTFIPIAETWESYRQSWSKNHRHRIGGRLRRLNEQGEVRLNRLVPASLAEAQPLLERAMRIEDGGWKGREGTSMLRSPGIADYLQRLAALLVPRKELEFAFLELDGEAIAFEILFHAKGVLHSYKVGYDERYQWYDPGHLLMHELLCEAWRTRRCTGYDCFGPNTVGLRRWRGTTYQVSQLVFAPSRWLGRALLYTYRQFRRPNASPASLVHAPADSNSHEPEAAEPRAGRVRSPQTTAPT
jgi:CelD/BcsL family acetyltransferase involved in cellulose biosynthesis